MTRHLPADLSAVLDLLASRGDAQYGGEAVSQRDHALQCATRAAQAGEPDSLVLACLLHDLGHLLGPAEDGGAPVVDHRHERRALPLLRRFLPAEVWAPVALHVEAKRYLCAVDPVYAAGLSPASAHSLALQGGAFTVREAEVFLAQAHAAAAVRLRQYDDLAKVPGWPTPALGWDLWG